VCRRPGRRLLQGARPDGAFEGPLTALLAGLAPAHTAEVIAVDRDRAWMLTRDAGTRLREAAPDRSQLAAWEQILPRYAELQLLLAPMVDDVLGLGVTDLRLGTLPALLAEAAESEALTRDDEDGMAPEERRALVDGLGDFARLCHEAADSGIPPSLQHDDLHDGNVFVRDGGHVFFDWGDSCVSHPFHSLVVPLRATAYKLGLQPGGPEVVRLRDAYLEPWTSVLPRAELVVAAELARRTGTVQRALAWYRVSRSMAVEEREEYAASVPYGLKLYLADAPFGAWT
jgi:Phosphotransferase enzyme family